MAHIIGIPHDCTFSDELAPIVICDADCLFHPVQIGSKDGAVSHRWSPFPSSALRTGRATRRCTQLARIVLSPISCLCHSNHLDDGACDIPDKAPSPVAPVPMPSHSPVLVSALMPLPAGWGDVLR